MKRLVVTVVLCGLAIQGAVIKATAQPWSGATGGSATIGEWLGGLGDLPRADDSVPLADIMRVAQLKARSIWGDHVALGPCIPYFGLDGRVLCYHCCVARTGRDFPRLGTDLDRQLVAPSAYRRFGHVVVGARFSAFPVAVAGEDVPLLLREMVRVAGSASAALSGRSAVLSRVFITGTLLDLVCEFVSDGDTVYVDPYSGRSVGVGVFQSLVRVAQPYLFRPNPEHAIASRNRWQRVMREGIAQFGVHRVQNHENIECYRWAFGCSPTSGAMVLSYYDNKLTDYGWLLWYHYEHVDPVSGERLFHTDRGHKLLAVEMNTDTVNPVGQGGGTTQWDSIHLGMRNYVQSLGYGVTVGFGEGGPANHWAWTAVVNEIGSNRPTIWSVAWTEPTGPTAHSMAAYGYTDAPDDSCVLLYDTWHQGEQEWHYREAYVGRLYPLTYVRVSWASLTSGRPSNLRLTQPLGGQGWGLENGEGEVLCTGEAYSIRWSNYGSPTGYVKILVSTDGGNGWSYITENTPNDGEYSWTPVQTTERGRISVQFYNTQGNITAEDGSWGNFTVRDNPLPPQPMPTAPPDGGTVGTATPTLQVQTMSGVDQYDFRVYQGGSAIRQGAPTSPSWTVSPALSNNQTYTWKCRAHNANGWGEYFSPNWSFTVDVQGPPDPPVHISPPNGGIVTTPRPTLQVQAVPGAIWYLYLVTRNRVYVRDAKVASSSWQLDIDLQNGYVYEWQVRCSTAAGRSEWTDYWTFAVEVGGPPPSPEDWPMFHRDSCHAGYSPERILPPYEVAWSYQVPGDWHSSTSLAVLGQYVVFGVDYGSGSQGNCYCIDTLGTYKWLYNIGGNIGGSTPCIAGGRVYFNARSDEGTRGAFSIALSDGQWVWHEPPSPGPYDLGTNAPATVSRGNFLSHSDYTPAVTVKDSFFCRNANTGVRSWAYAQNAWITWSWGAAATDGSFVYFLAVASDPAQNGLYKLSLGGAYQGFYGSVSLPSTYCSPALWNGKLYMVDANRVVCVNASSMTLAWSQTATAAIGTPAVGNGAVYIGTSDGKLHAFDANTGTPLSGWPVTVGSSQVNTPSIAENVVFFGTANGYFYAYDGTSGTQLYSYNCGSQITNCPAISRGRIYVTTTGGKVFAFRHGVQTYHDVGVVSIDVPSGTIDSGTVVTPQARVKNYGTQSETFNVTMEIGAWSNTQSKTVGAGATETVSFSNWTAGQRGSFATKCSVYLATDQERRNDTLSGSVFVRVSDVGVTRLVAPTGVIDSGTAVTPVCSVYNYGTQSESYSVRMRIGTSYDEVVTIGHAAGTRMYVTYPSWTALQRGSYAVSCSTELAGDMRAANNRLTGSVSVTVRDVGCTRILVPAGAIDSGTTVPPACSVYNFGTTTETYQVRMKIGTGYNQTALVSSHAPCTPAYVTFPNWTATVRWTNVVTCSTELVGDARTSNDKKNGGVHVRVRDVGVLEIIAPTDTVDSGAVVTPVAAVGNFGTVPEYFDASFRITAIGYFETIPETLLPGEIDTVEFAPCTLNVVGSVMLRCSTALAGDMIPANNVVRDSVYVLPGTGIAGGEEVVGLARQFALHGIFPNPATRSAVVRYSLGMRCHSLVSIFDVRGSLVRELVDADEEPGRREVAWDRRDDRGQWVASGVYFCRLAAAEFQETQKLLLLE